MLREGNDKYPSASGDGGYIDIDIKSGSLSLADGTGVNASTYASIPNYSTGDVRNVTNENTSPLWKKGDPIIEPQGVYRLLNGQLMMSRECQND